MKSFAFTVLLWLCAGCAIAAAPTTRLLSSSDGQLHIDRDGSVLQVELEQNYGKALDQVLRDRIMAWRFEPIIENGRSVQAIAHMRLDLAAEVANAGEDFSIRIVQVSFLDPPDMQALKTKARGSAPKYPTEMIRNRLSAKLLLTVELDAQGKALRSALSEGMLYHDAERVPSAERYLAKFAKAGLDWANRWQFDPSEDGKPRLVSVPLEFFIHTNAPWRRAHPVPVVPQPWTLQGEVALLGPSGGAIDARVRLLSELDRVEG